MLLLHYIRFDINFVRVGLSTIQSENSPAIYGNLYRSLVYVHIIFHMHVIQNR